MKPCSVVVCGVGGQGVLLLARTLAEAAFIEGLDVVQSEIHGLAQRGGAVVAHVRFGSRVHSPLVDPYKADLLLSLEALEALRNRVYAGRKTSVVCNMLMLPPPSAAAMRMKIPKLDEIKEAFAHAKLFKYVEAQRIAGEKGLPQGANMVVLGFSFGLGLLPLSEKGLLEAIKTVVPDRYIEKNIELFNVGRKVAESRK